VESGLLFRIPLVGCDRARSACGAGSDPAILTGAFKMLPAGDVVIIALGREGRDRASRETRAARALFARVRIVHPRAQVQPLSESKCPAVGMPEAPFRMNEQAQHRAMHRLRLQRPRLKIQRRIAAERVKGRRAVLGRESADQPLGPSVERVRQTVASLRRSRKQWPLIASRPAEQGDRQSRGAVGQWRYAIFGRGMKATPERETVPVDVAY
jgi:hypothetical protein